MSADIEALAEEFARWVCDQRPVLREDGLEERLVGAAWSKIERLAEEGGDPEMAVERLGRSFSIQMPEGSIEKLTAAAHNYKGGAWWAIPHSPR